VVAVRLFNRVGFGRLDNDKADWISTTWPERLPAVVLTGLVILAGIWPQTITGFSELSTAGLALRQNQPVVASLLAATSPASDSTALELSA
jgi:NAD(P)H-quinone oxidoreductase subunit 4